MELDGKDTVKGIEILVGRKDPQTSEMADGAQQEIRVGTLHALDTAPIEEMGRHFEIRGIEPQVREGAKLFLQGSELRFLANSREQLLPNRADDRHLEIGDQSTELGYNRRFALGLAAAQCQRPNRCVDQDLQATLRCFL